MEMARIGAICALIGAVTGASPALADRLSPYWQGEREAANALVDAACARGDLDALGRLGTMAWDDLNGAALNAMFWIMTDEGADCPGVDLPHDPARIAAAARYSHAMGYPIGSYNYAWTLMEGRYGVPAEPQRGVAILIEAAEGGYAAAAEQLATIFAEGQFGRSADARRAARFADLAAELGLPEARLSRLRAALAAASAAPATGAPAPAPAPAPATDGTGRGPFHVSVTLAHGGNVPRIGDREAAGLWTWETVYVAQGFSREGDCWMASTRYLHATAAVDRYDGTDARLARLLDDAEARRAQNGLGTEVVWFATLEDGVAFQQRDGGWRDSSGAAMMWSQAAAEAWGPQCPGGVTEIVYPAPVVAPGY